VNAGVRSIGFIGAGKVGSSLAINLSEAGYHVAVVADRDNDAAARLAETIEGSTPVHSAQEAADRADFVFITTPDDKIGPVCDTVQWKQGQSVVHCSGAASIDVLASAAGQGASTGSFHPCQAFASSAEALKNIPGSTFAIEADIPLAGILENIAIDLGCEYIRLGPGVKALYHAAAVLVSNYVVTLLKISTDFFKEMGVERDSAVKILMPLMKGNLFNIEQLGIPKCLTGPIARGDTGTIEKHAQSILERSPENLGLYAELGLMTLPIAIEKGGLSEKAETKLKRLFRDALQQRLKP
jgi:predicted short-subunit dehydrogenase-like oxidoreductase (DUF2520 family)